MQLALRGSGGGAGSACIDPVVCSMRWVHVRTHDLYMQVFAPSACGVSPFNLIK